MRVSEREWYSPYLQSDEDVLWTGKPDKHEIFDLSELAKGAPMLLFLAWGGFILYLLFSDGGVPKEILIGACVVVGVWLALVGWTGFGKALLSMYRLRKTEYVITSRRILRKMGRAVDGLDSRSLSTPNLKKGALHYGTITFGPGLSNPDARYTRHPSLAVAAAFELRAIPEAAKVMQIIAGMDKSAAPVEPLSDLPIIPLEEGEHVLWQGYPQRTSLPLIFTMNFNSEKLMVGVWFTLLPVALMAMLIWARAPFEAWLYCIPFWGVMLYGLNCLGLFSLRVHRQMQSEEYVITDRRVLRRVKEKVGERIIGQGDMIFLAQGRDGCGTVVIGNVNDAYREARRRPRNFSMANCLGFQLRAISDPTRAMDALSALIPSAEEEA